MAGRRHCRGPGPATADRQLGPGALAASRGRQDHGRRQAGKALFLFPVCCRRPSPQCHIFIVGFACAGAAPTPHHITAPDACGFHHRRKHIWCDACAQALEGQGRKWLAAQRAAAGRSATATLAAASAEVLGSSRQQPLNLYCRMQLVTTCKRVGYWHAGRPLNRGPASQTLRLCMTLCNCITCISFG